MPYGPNFGYGFQRLIDSHQRYMRAGSTVYLRLKNFPDTQEDLYSELGFMASPSGNSELLGTTDIEISPPCSVEPVSVHNIGQSMGKLRFGAKVFVVSATFVDAQVAEQGLSDQSLVWRGSNVVGLVADNQLFSIEDVVKKEIAGKTVVWILTCNAAEIPVSTG